MNLKTTVGHKHEIFIRLIQLINARSHGRTRRRVLCRQTLLITQIPLCTIQVRTDHGARLIFKSIIRKSISLLKNTQKNIQEIADFFNFPNASYFGTFFKKQTGMSPQQYRKK